MRQRTRKYIDVYLKSSELTKIKKGFTAHRWVKLNGTGIGVAIKIDNNKISKKIAKLEALLRELKRRGVEDVKS